MFQHRGVWYTRVKDETGRLRKHSLRTSDEKEAIVREADLRRRASLPPSERKETLSLERILGKVVAAKRRDRSAATVEYYVWKARSLNASLGPIKDVRQITASIVDRLVEAREADGVSQNCISKELGVLCHALRIAWRLRAFDVDPRTIMPLGFSDGYKPRDRVLPPEELRKILQLCTTSDQIVYICFSVATSARHAEICRAKTSDIHMKEGLIQVHGTKTEGSDRWVPLTPLSKPFVEEVLRQVPPGRLLISSNMGKGRFLGKKAKQLKLPHVSPNDLRRTCATWLVEAGVDLYLVSKILGHKDTRMVERVYAKLRKQVLARLVNSQMLEQERRNAQLAKLNNIFSGIGETNGDTPTETTSPNQSN